MQQQLLIKNPYNTYKEQGVLMASPIELIIMLYDGLRKNLLLARKDIDSKNDPAAAHGHLMKAQLIVEELVNSLDMNYEISQELLDIYEFLLYEIGQINISKDSARIEPLLPIIAEFRDAWGQVEKQYKEGTLDVSDEK